MIGRNWEIRNCDCGAEGWSYDEPIKLVWTDPPFGTQKRQQQGGVSYSDVGRGAAVDLVWNSIKSLYGRLTNDAVVCICADYRIIHNVVTNLDNLLHFQGEVIWTFGLGRPRTNWWPVRHNTIATFTKSKALPTFDASAIPREARKAPKKGYEGDKMAGSVWDYTLSNTAPERVGYPNQKPLAIIEPFVLAHTNPGDVVADPFAGSGSTGIAALMHGRRFLGQDTSPDAIRIASQRLHDYENRV
jgi:site-specific DNA-methyltransferase (adenine-specific)